MFLSGFQTYAHRLTHNRDHIDRLVEDRLRRSLPIITTSRAKEQLTTKNRDEEDFTEVYDLDTFNSMMIHITPYKTTSEVLSHRTPAIQVTATPGKHIPSGRIETANDFTGAVPPVNGWILELGYFPSLEVHSSVDAGLFFKCGYRIYISNDTLPISELSKIPELYTDADRPIDLLLVHLGGTTIPRQGLPLLMVTMDAGMGVELMRLVRPDVTIPLHFDDHNVMSEGGGMAAFEKEVEEAGLGNRVVWLERGEEVRFRVR